MTTADTAQAARRASRTVGTLGSEARVQGLHRMADALVAHTGEILAANQLDRDEADQAVHRGEMASALADRLVLSGRRLEQLADGIRSIANQDEPIGRVLTRTELADGLVLRQETAPLGVVLVIFESRPDVLPQLAALALRSGNGLLLKGGKEAARSNRILHRVLTRALEPQLPGGLLGLVETRAEVGALLALDDLIDLVVPRGSNQLVRHIQQNTRIPVLGHADGICHVFVDARADADRARTIVLDAKTQYPAACNAMETLLVHVDFPHTRALLDALADAGVALFGGPRAATQLDLTPAETLRREYGELAATVELVDDVEAAIDHIHTHGSGHTESVVTEDAQVARRFLDGVDSACVFHNASTRFADGYRFGLGAEVGISTSRIHARGPVGVDGLLTTRWKLEGSGHAVGPFSRDEQRFTHRPLPL
ncbi:MAG: glutamate-5-semialdehyde dehydrogenase [Myxococcota bacterium]|nr:glutamate-5-semialdehyde dehydrogenase [Myxococcota bacterium]